MAFSFDLLPIYSRCVFSDFRIAGIVEDFAILEQPIIPILIFSKSVIFFYQDVHPPSTTIVEPVIYDEPELHKNSTSLLSSSFCIIRFIGVIEAYLLMKDCSWSYSTPPGAIEFTRIFGAKCVERNFVRLITPAFEIL